MKQGTLYALIVIVVGIAVIVGGHLVMNNRNQTQGNAQVVNTTPTADKQIDSKPAPVTDRVPGRFACVGEYCDGSMDGDDHLQKYTVLQIPLITDGGNLGCGAKLFFAPHTVPKTTAVLDETYKLLFDIKPVPEIPADGFRNVVGVYTKLHYDSVALIDGTAKVFLTGNMYGPGHCAEPEFRAQIEQAALQFPSVQKLEVYLNNALFDWCSLDVSDGEGPCPEKPQYWTVTK